MQLPVSICQHLILARASEILYLNFCIILLMIQFRFPISNAVEGSIRNGNLDLVRLFLNNGADPTLVDGFGCDAATWSLRISSCCSADLNKGE